MTYINIMYRFAI